MFQDPAFWVGFAFFLLVVFTLKPVVRALNVALDSRIGKIQRDLEEALRLKDEAQELLASYQRKQKESALEAQRIIDHAQSETNRIMLEAEKDLEENLNNKIQLAMRKISTYENAVLQEVRANSIDMAIKTVRHLVKNNISHEVSEELVMRAMDEMNKRLN